MNYKICKQVNAHLEKKEEEYDRKIDDYRMNVTTNDGEDGSELIEEYFWCKYECEKLEEMEEEKLKQEEEEEEEKKKEKKTKYKKPRKPKRHMFHNIMKRNFGDNNATKRFHIPGMLLHLRKRRQEIKNGDLSQHFEALRVLEEALDHVQDVMEELPSMNRIQLLQIAAVHECPQIRLL